MGKRELNKEITKLGKEINNTPKRKGTDLDKGLLELRRERAIQELRMMSFSRSSRLDRPNWLVRILNGVIAFVEYLLDNHSKDGILIKPTGIFKFLKWIGIAKEAFGFIKTLFNDQEVEGEDSESVEE